MNARPLTDLEKKWALAALLDREVTTRGKCVKAVESSVLIPMRPSSWKLTGLRSVIAKVALSNQAAGITLGHKIYIRQTLFDEDGSLPLELVVHEVAHVAQYLRDGTFGFLTKYLRDYADGRGRGLGDHDAYLAIPHEVEARKVGAYLSEHSTDPELRAVERLYF